MPAKVHVTGRFELAFLLFAFPIFAFQPLAFPLASALPIAFELFTCQLLLTLTLLTLLRGLLFNEDSRAACAGVIEDVPGILRGNTRSEGERTHE
jgi:hypothetical protein